MCQFHLLSPKLVATFYFWFTLISVCTVRFFSMFQFSLRFCRIACESVNRSKWNAAFKAHNFITNTQRLFTLLTNSFCWSVNMSKSVKILKWDQTMFASTLTYIRTNKVPLLTHPYTNLSQEWEKIASI